MYEIFFFVVKWSQIIMYNLFHLTICKEHLYCIPHFLGIFCHFSWHTNVDAIFDQFHSYTYVVFDPFLLIVIVAWASKKCFNSVCHLVMDNRKRAKIYWPLSMKRKKWDSLLNFSKLFERLFSSEVGMVVLRLPISFELHLCKALLVQDMIFHTVCPPVVTASVHSHPEICIIIIPF